MEGPKISQDELVEKLKQQVALENIELLLTVSNILHFYTTYSINILTISIILQNNIKNVLYIVQCTYNMCCKMDVYINTLLL